MTQGDPEFDVPERDDGGEPWTGRIWSEGEQSQRWNFETIRHANLKKIYGCGVFEGAKPVSVLLDHPASGDADPSVGPAGRSG